MAVCPPKTTWAGSKPAATMQTVLQQLESQSAISSCMTALGSKDRTVQSFKAEAMFRRPDETFCRGNIDVSFDNFNAMSGWEINCDRDIMSGFGIRHGNFDSNWQGFSFDSATKELTITDENYCFVFRF